MNVRLLATQLLITAVSKILPKYGPADKARIAKPCLLLAKLFDVMKPSNTLFSSTNNPRFLWLKNQFFKYFEEWLRSIRIKPRPKTYEGMFQVCHHKHTKV